MAAALLGKTDVGVKEFGRDVDVAEVPHAKLMYYLDSICYALNLDKSESGIRKLREYRNYRSLSSDEIDELLILCAIFSPDVLLNKCIFMDDEMCGNNMNKFYEVNAVSHRFLVTEEIVIGGQTRRVMKILCFRKLWLETFYLEPITHFKERLSAVADRIAGRQGRQRQATPTAARAPATQQSSRQVTPRPAPPPASRPTTQTRTAPAEDKQSCIIS